MLEAVEDSVSKVGPRKGVTPKTRQSWIKWTSAIQITCTNSAERVSEMNNGHYKMESMERRVDEMSCGDDVG